jgi:signal transduction histidine kinase
VTGQGTTPPEGGGQIDIFRWLWRSYARAALVPLVLVEFVLVGAYLLTHNYMASANISLLREQARNRLAELVDGQASRIGEKLDTVRVETEIFRRATEHVFTADSEPAPAESARYALSADGVYYTPKDDGGAALFYSTATAVGETERRKAWKTAALDPLMRNIRQASPLVMQIYLNTFDSMNRIYPFFDVLKQYPSNMVIPEFNFYYEADAARNPERNTVWTEVYLDPAGQGWMASCIAPVYTGDFLQGVVGLDVTVEVFVKQVLDLQIPWAGYALLVSRDGGIMAMPPAAEVALGLSELTSHHYSEAIRREELKPDAFNIRKHPLLQDIARDISSSGATGVSEIEISGKQLAAWSTIPQTGWTLLAIVPEKNIYAESDALATRFRNIGLLMITGLVIFYLAFFLFLYSRARAMAHVLGKPLGELNAIAEDIGRGNYQQTAPQTPVLELQRTAQQIVNMGKVLGQSNESLREARDAAEQANASRSSFISQMTHELRTPMNAIIGFAQLLELDRDRLDPEHREFVEHIHGSAKRLLGLLNRVIEVARSGKVPTSENHESMLAGVQAVPARPAPAAARESAAVAAPPKAPAAAGPEAGSPEHAEKVRTLLAEVQLLLRSHSFSSVSRFRSLQQLLKDHPEAAAIAAIGKLIEEMRFREALDQLQALPLEHTTGAKE